MAVPAESGDLEASEYLAVHSYQSDAEGDLVFSEGDSVWVYWGQENGWWFGSAGGLQGWFPESYVEVREVLLCVVVSVGFFFFFGQCEWQSVCAQNESFDMKTKIHKVHVTLHSCIAHHHTHTHTHTHTQHTHTHIYVHTNMHTHVSNLDCNVLIL